MNKDRRDRLQNIIEDLGAIIDEEQEAYDNLPEAIQSSERGDAMQEQIDGMTDAKDTLETVSE